MGKSGGKSGKPTPYWFVNVKFGWIEVCASYLTLSNLREGKSLG